MTATYTFDVVCTLDGYGSYDSSGYWGGYWGKQGPESLDRRLEVLGAEQRMVLGANTFRDFLEFVAPSTEESRVDDHQWSDRAAADLRWRSKLRPRAARAPDARRQHPGARLPTQPARLRPSPP